MSSFKEIAENATIQSFLNCYLRETGIETREIADGSQKTLIVPLERQQIEPDRSDQVLVEDGKAPFLISALLSNSPKRKAASTRLCDARLPRFKGIASSAKPRGCRG